MKINEVVVESQQSQKIDEGPLDFLGRVGAGIGGLATGGFTGASSAYQQKGAEQDLRDMAKRNLPALNQTIVGLKQQGIPEPQMAKHVQDWASKWFNIQAPPYPTPTVNPKSNLEYLKTVTAAMLYQPAKAAAPAAPAAPTARKVGSYPPPRSNPSPGVAPSVEVNGENYTYDLAKKTWSNEDAEQITDPEDIQALNKAYYEKMKGGAATPAATTPAAPGGATTPVAAAAAPGGATTPAAPAATPGAAASAAPGTAPATPTSATGATASPAQAIFSDPAKFTAEFDAYLKGLTGNAPIALRSALKTMWMKTGGLRAS